jgi:DNA (cytosine-5)-methyltransferase 1
VLTLGSLFDGIGGFPLAASRAGILPVWASEIDKKCQQVTAYHFPDMVQLGDITKLDGRSLSPVDIITGGSPCQDLSVAGKQAGLKGERSGLFMEMMRIINEMRSEAGKPRYVVWENVPGAFSSNKGEDFKAVLEAFAGEVPMPKRWEPAGMVSGRRGVTCWRVLDAQYFGVPQRRRRIFLIHDFGGERSREILFEQRGVPGNNEPSREAGDEVARSLTNCPTWRGADHDNLIPCYWNGEKQVANTLDASVAARRQAMPDKNRLNAVVVRTFPNELHRSNPLEDKTFTLETGNRQAVGHNAAVRRLTPTECERLQGYPDGWTGLEGISDSARYRMLGNSVAVPVVEWIMRRIVTPQEKPPVVQESTPEGGIVVKVPEKPMRVVNRGKPCQPVVKHPLVQHTLDMYPTEA